MNKNEILELLEKNFNSNEEECSIDTAGFIHANGDILSTKEFDRYPPQPNLGGLRFGKVAGDFDISLSKIMSLRGSPYYVGGSFNISACRYLSNLQFGPKHVGKYYYVRDTVLHDLGAIAGVTIGKTLFIDWNEDLNLLPLIDCRCDNITIMISASSQTHKTTEILRPYTNSVARAAIGKAKLSFAIDLIKAGFAKNMPFKWGGQ